VFCLCGAFFGQARGKYLKIREKLSSSQQECAKESDSLMTKGQKGQGFSKAESF